VILVDANLLIYAIDSDSPQQDRARPWLERVLSDAAPVGLPWIVILAFVRITTRGHHAPPAGARRCACLLRDLAAQLGQLVLEADASKALP
jgi:predicted nucleic acid-binding protein